MENYLLFLIVATVTVLSLAPGVILTLSNTIRFGVCGAANGICGIAFGTLIVAGISATSLGVVLATSTITFNVMKYIGAIYLIYLGIKLWRAAPAKMEVDTASSKSVNLQFIEGLTLQLTNPKAVFFFLSVFPQFVDFNVPYNP